MKAVLKKIFLFLAATALLLYISAGTTYLTYSLYLKAAIEFQMRITQVRVRTASSYLPYAFRLMKKKQNFMSLIIPCKRKTLRSGQMQICLP